jgi:predicted DsbA family dithiol-disulfide isomerase
MHVSKEWIRGKGTPLVVDIEVWTDVVCPWCAISHRRFLRALAAFPDRRQVRVHYRSFELDPAAPTVPGPSISQLMTTEWGVRAEDWTRGELMIRELAEADGYPMRLDRVRPVNSFDAHRLIHLAAQHGVADELLTVLFDVHFIENINIADHSTLIGLGVLVGLDAQEAETVLAGDAFTAHVRDDERRAAGLEIRSVPTFLMAGQLALSGAPSVEALLDLLDEGVNQSAAQPDVA